jgi:DNA gyrase/topoisomerase IV subunit A
LFPCPTPGDNQASASGTFYGKSGTGPGAVDQTWDENLHIVFATQSGIVKKSNLSDYANVRRGGIIAIQIEEGDRLIDAKLTNGKTLTLRSARALPCPTVAFGPGGCTAFDFSEV